MTIPARLIWGAILTAAVLGLMALPPDAEAEPTAELSATPRGLKPPTSPRADQPPKRVRQHQNHLFPVPAIGSSYRRGPRTETRETTAGPTGRMTKRRMT